jgi:N-acetylglucosamine malate deacetylase 1
MGGTIARLAQQGHEVLLLDMTNGEPTPLGDVLTRQREAEAARAVLDGGTDRVHRRMLMVEGEARGHGGEGAWGGRALPNRFVEHSIAARRAVASVIREHQAEIVFTPFPEDAHPDHIATTRIVEDARFDAKLSKIDLPGEKIYPRWLFYYYATHLRWVANPSFLIDVTGFEQQKIAAMQAYHTQFVAPGRIGANPAGQSVESFVTERLGYFGSRIATRYAEPFFTKEPVGLNGLSGLVM